ncbi:MAG: hypothetical protein R2734_04050 [Nocardioides sp.]
MKPARRAPRVEISLLGAVEVRIGGAALPVTAPSSASCSPMLALAGGQPVTADALCDLLWPERVPRRPGPPSQHHPAAAPC